MKKLVFMFVAVAAISFASCGQQAQQAAPVDTDTVAVVDSADTAVVDSAAAPADTTVAE